MSNITMPFVSATARMDRLSAAIKERAPFIVDRFWVMVKKSRELDAILFTSSNGSESEREAADATLCAAMMTMAGEMLPSDVMEDIRYEVSQFVTHCEVSQASMMEPDEEAAVWAVWERMDEAAEAQAQNEAWRNEY